MSDTTVKRDRLVKAMVPSDRDSSTSHSHIDAGYTYLGQFVSHDIVPPTNSAPVASAGSAVFADRSDVGPFLELDSLYGSWPYDCELFDKMRFIVSDRNSKHPIDLNRVVSKRSGPSGLSDAMAKIPEPRNDQNTVVSQLHLLLQLFHNRLIDRGLASSVEDARRLVTKTFQIIVIEDFLQTILHKDVFNYVFRRNERPLGFDLESKGLPPEFSHAAFRFGHSMVRDRYELNDSVGASVSTRYLFRRSKKLTDEFEIDWSKFFGRRSGAGGHVQKSMKIDAIIEEVMHSELEVARSIVRLNLEAAQDAKLPSGYAYIHKRIPPAIWSLFKGKKLSDLGGLKSSLGRQDDYKISDLPLWPYILLEAFGDSVPSIRARGSRLGVVASLICADVLAESIAGATNSVYEGQGYCYCYAIEQLEELKARILPTIDGASAGVRLKMRDLIDFVQQKP